jgi:hypothetical protein
MEQDKEPVQILTASAKQTAEQEDWGLLKKRQSGLARSRSAASAIGSRSRTRRHP